MATLEEHEDKRPSLIDDTIIYIKTHKIQLILLVIAIIFLLYPSTIPSKYIQHGGEGEGEGQGGSGGATPPPANPVVNKVREGIERIGSGIMRAFSVIASIFLIFGLISLPFIIYAIVFYFVVKRGFAAASTL